MGILNVTPDSFSDGGRHGDAAAAVDAGLQMVADGAAIVDVGGESTRPYAEPVPLDVEIERVLPVVDGLVAGGVVVSVDTSKPEVARVALDHGAAIINDVTGLTDPDMRSVCARAKAGVVIMHMRGTPADMQDDPVYDDVVEDVSAFLAAQTRTAIASGIPIEAIALDPGIGFGKTFEHNIALLGNLDRFVHLGFPLLIGSSRKGFWAPSSNRSGARPRRPIGTVPRQPRWPPRSSPGRTSCASTTCASGLR
jgi:dihydropteroate synthase